MFIFHWMFDKLGYMPKIDVQVGKVNIKAAWPFPGEDKDFFGIDRKKPNVEKKPVARKPAAKKPAVVAKTTHAKKAK